MFCLICVLGVLCVLSLLLYVVWKNVADADLTLLWKEQFGVKPGEMSIVLIIIIIIIIMASVISHRSL